MLYGIIGFILGIFIGVISLAFIIGATKLNKEFDAFNEGYIQGLKNARKK